MNLFNILSDYGNIVSAQYLILCILITEQFMATQLVFGWTDV